MRNLRRRSSTGLCHRRRRLHYLTEAKPRDLVVVFIGLQVMVVDLIYTKMSFGLNSHLQTIRVGAGLCQEQVVCILIFFPVVYENTYIRNTLSPDYIHLIILWIQRPYRTASFVTPTHSN